MLGFEAASCHCCTIREDDGQARGKRGVDWREITGASRNQAAEEEFEVKVVTALNV